MQTRGEWSDIFKVLKKNPTNLNSVSSKITIQKKRGVGSTEEILSKTKKPREFITSRPALQEMLKEVLQLLRKKLYRSETWGRASKKEQIKVNKNLLFLLFLIDHKR